MRLRVLIVRLGAFGDIIHTLPLAHDLHQAGWTVDWLLEERWSSLLRGSPAINHLHTVARRPDLRARRIGWRALRARGYDAVIDAQGLAKSALWAIGSGAAKRVGHARGRAREGSWLVSNLQSPCTATHVIDQQRALAIPLLGKHHPRGRWQFPLPSWQAEKAWARTWLEQHGAINATDATDATDTSGPVFVNVGAGWPTKVWPQERLVECAQQLCADNQRVVILFGSPQEREIATAITTHVPTALLAPETNLPQLAGLLHHGKALISGDTGPLHLALALNTPAIGLFGPVPASRNGPRGLGYKNLQAPAAAWERKDVSKVKMGAISAADVLSTLQDITYERQSGPAPSATSSPP